MKSNKSKRLKQGVGFSIVLLTCLHARDAWCDQWTAALTPISASAQTYNGALLTYVTTSQAVVNPAGCPAGDGYITIDPAIVKESLAAALTAIAAGRQVQIYVSSTQCVQNRPMIINFTML